MRLLAPAAFVALLAMSFSSTSVAQTELWYYCSTTHEFYPYTQRCSVPWRAVHPYNAVPLGQPRNIVPQQEQPGSAAQDNAQPTSPPEQPGSAAQDNSQPASPPAQPGSTAQDNSQPASPPEQPGNAAQDNSQAASPPSGEPARDETAKQPSTDQSGEPSSASPELLILLIAALVVAGAIIAVIYKNYRKRVLTEGVMKAVYATVTQHKRALVRRRFQTLRHDDYGNVLKEPWRKELFYFVDKVLDPAIRQVGPEEYALYETMRAAVVLTIEHLIEQSAGSTQNFTLGPNLTPTDYEQYCAEQLRSAGWSANTTKASGDQGTDIIAQNGDQRLVVQCKLYNHPVGNKAVQEVAAARVHEQADWAAVVTNSSYTSSAQQLAATNAVLLLHHSDLGNIDDLLSA